MSKTKFIYAGRDLEAMSHAYNYRDWIITKMKPVIGRHVVEVGAGLGDFSELLLQQDIESLTIIEPSANMYDALHNRLADNSKVRIINEYFGNSLPELPGNTDTLLYINTLEHIEDYEVEIEHMFQALIPGGYLGIFVPALPWMYGSFDREVGHFRRFEKSVLDKIIQKTGFKILESYHMDFLGIPFWWIQYCLLKRKHLKKYQVILYDKIFVPLNRFIEEKIIPPLGKNILLLAQK